MSEEGLWPTDLAAKRQRSTEPSPRQILEYQAQDLAEKTKGALRGLVEPGSERDFVTLDFLIVAPGLEDYEYRLFKARHKLLPQYPVSIILDAADHRDAASPTDFRRQLAEIFGSDSTRRLITQLLDLSEDRRSNGKSVRRRRTG